MTAPEVLFDAEAARYDAAYDASGAPGRALRDRLATVLELAGDGPGDVLDAGMGPGRLLAALERRSWRVSGVDVSAEMLALARARLPEAAAWGGYPGGLAVEKGEPLFPRKAG